MAIDKAVRSAHDLEGLAAQVARALQQTAGDDARPLFRPLLALLAKGDPVPPAALAAATGRPAEEVTRTLEAFGAEFDEAGQIVGAGLTLVPTPHQFEVDGRRLYAWCALDTLMFPFLLGRPARVESPCATTGVPVRVTVDPDGIRTLDPPTTAVSLVLSPAPDTVRRAFCHHVHFFVSPEAASDWLAQHPEATVVPAAEAYRFGRALARHYLEPAADDGAAHPAKAYWAGTDRHELWPNRTTDDTAHDPANQRGDA